MIKEYPDPYLIEFKKLGEPGIGYISVAQNGELPFELKRVFWTYSTPEDIIRGNHAHHEMEEILIAVSGQVMVAVEKLDGKIENFKVDDPNVGLYIPPKVWRTVQNSLTSTYIVLVSTLYEEKEYIREYDEFAKYKR